MGGLGNLARKSVQRATNMKVSDYMIRGTADIAATIGRGAYHTAAGASRARSALHLRGRMGVHSNPRVMGLPRNVRRYENVTERRAEIAGIKAGFESGGRQAGINVLNTAKGAGRRSGRLALGAHRRIGAPVAGLITHPGMRGTFARRGLIGGAGVAGLTVGSYKGVASMRMPGPDLGSQQGMSFYGPGYYTWAKGPGSGMPSNHLSTQGLTQSLHRMRHR